MSRVAPCEKTGTPVRSDHSCRDESARIPVFRNSGSRSSSTGAKLCDAIATVALSPEGEDPVNGAPAARGFIVLDAGLKVIASNSEVMQILTFPGEPEKSHSLNGWLTDTFHSKLVDKQLPSGIASEVQSSRRTYSCRTFPLNCLENSKQSSAHSQLPLCQSLLTESLLIVMIERKNNQATSIEQLSERYGLTPRERETVQFLVEGLTSKEIAERMKISANTVKAFIRLVMMKMGVSTRSGIVGKIACPKA